MKGSGMFKSMKRSQSPNQSDRTPPEFQVIKEFIFQQEETFFIFKVSSYQIVHLIAGGNYFEQREAVSNYFWAKQSFPKL